MQAPTLFIAALLVLGCGSSAQAGAMESSAQLDQVTAAEQQHLDQASSRMRQGISRDGDLPLELKRPSGPQAPNLLQLGF
jgi:C4-dicarboxylate-specific signal transduction histidine kinase